MWDNLPQSPKTPNSGISGDNYDSGTAASEGLFPLNLVPWFPHRNPDLRIIVFILRSLGIFVRHVIHFNTISCRKFIMLQCRKPFGEYLYIHILQRYPFPVPTLLAFFCRSLIRRICFPLFSSCTLALTMLHSFCIESRCPKSSRRRDDGSGEKGNRCKSCAISSL